jgi:DNA polymerase III alpha subunit
MHINEYGQISRNEKEVVDLLYQNPELQLNDINFSELEVIEKFNQSAKNCGLNITLHSLEKINKSITEFDGENQKNWFIPDVEYCPNLFEMLYSKCETDEQRDRVNTELELYIKHNMIELLHYLKYLVDLMREKKIVWGVGRGSSVASYVLYLIGVHKIDSIKYNLDIGEFLK